MTCQSRVYPWCHTVHQPLPHLSRPQAYVLCPDLVASGGGVDALLLTDGGDPVLAVATLWVVTLGGTAELAQLTAAATAPPRQAHQVSVFRRG